MYVRKISEIIKKFINMMSKVVSRKYNENYLIGKALKELLSMYTYSDSDFRKKFYKDENALPILHYIGTSYEEKNKKTLYISSEELILTNSAIKIMYITSQCLEPICKILYPDGLPDINLNDTINLQKSLKKLKGVLPPLTPEEVYYAFKFLDDVEIRNALSFVNGNAFNKIYKAYEANRKSAFIKGVDEVNNIKLSLYVYISLIRSNKTSSLLKQYLHTIDFNNNLKYQHIMYGFSPSLMKAYKINQDRDAFAKMKVSKLIKSHNDVISDYKTLINSAISNPDIPIAFREQAKDFWQKRNSVFNDIKVKKNKSKSKELYDLIVLNFIIEGILHAIHKLMQEDISSDKDEFEQHVINTDKCTLGISNFVRDLIWCSNNDVYNKRYRKVLEYLFSILSGDDSILRYADEKNVEISNKSFRNKSNLIEHTNKYDFIYILGGILYEGEKTGENPILNWNHKPQYELSSFLYAFYETKVEKSQKDKRPIYNILSECDLGSKQKCNCYSSNGKAIDLAEQYRDNAKVKAKMWSSIIYNCCTIVKNEIS